MKRKSWHLTSGLGLAVVLIYLCGSRLSFQITNRNPSNKKILAIEIKPPDSSLPGFSLQTKNFPEITEDDGTQVHIKNTQLLLNKITTAYRNRPAQRNHASCYMVTKREDGGFSFSPPNFEPGLVVSAPQ